MQVTDKGKSFMVTELDRQMVIVTAVMSSALKNFCLYYPEEFRKCLAMETDDPDSVDILFGLIEELTTHDTKGGCQCSGEEKQEKSD